MTDRFSMQGRVAAVTGGAGGLGRAMAEALAEAGAHVVVADIDGAAARRTAKAIGGEGVTLDVADRAAVRLALTAITARHGRLDVVIANAGISAGPGFRTEQGRIANVQDAVWDRVVAINLTGVFATLQAGGGVMAEQGSGSLIAVASIAGLKAEPMVGYAYAATKAAVANLTRQAAMEFAPKGVRVNAIAPGPFRTDIADGRIRQPENEAAFATTVPLGRIAEPEEIKGLALLLASEAGSFMTGTVIPIDGGIMAS